MLRTFHSWCAKGRGLEGELLSGMQGPSPQGGTAKGTRAHPGQKALGRSQSVGGLSGIVPVHGKSPSTSELQPPRRGLRGPIRGRTAKKKNKKQRNNTPNEEDETALTALTARPKRRMRENATTGHSVTQQSSQLRTLLHILPSPSPIACEQVLEKEAQSAIHLSVAFPSSAAARVQKLPFGTRVIVLPGLTTPTQQPFYRYVPCCCCCCQKPQMQCSVGGPR